MWHLQFTGAAILSPGEIQSLLTFCSVSHTPKRPPLHMDIHLKTVGEVQSLYKNMSLQVWPEPVQSCHSYYPFLTKIL